MDAVRIPPIFCPFLQELNPHVEAAQQHVLEWVQQFGLVQKNTAQQRFLRADFGWFAACTYPRIDCNALALVSDWFAWLFLIDDQLDDGLLGTQVEKAQEVMSELLTVIGNNINDAPAPAPRHELSQRSAAIATLADLWQRTASATQTNWRNRFYHHVSACFAAARWEAQNRVQGIVPTVNAYIEKRRDTGAIYICLDLIDVVNQVNIPEPVYNHPLFQTLLDSASNVICWCNDVFSLDKEIERGEYHNLVLVIQNAESCTAQEAIDNACALIKAETQRFLLAEQEIQGLFPEHIEDIYTYIEAMKSWMRGNLDWSSQTLRYTHIERRQSRERISYLETIV